VGDARYSPAQCIAAEPYIIQGNPNSSNISTSFAEQQNLTMRMNMRRFTRLTNAFSKKIENLEYAVALHFMYYNFARIHKTLTPKSSIGVTPAMAAGVSNHIWSIEEIVKLVDSN
ncbi:MAG TPA: IS1 family transposase, partial [Dehalococcoidia bacterium]|nr:IS1 family transposase [Dehalococcoidia bacterium]